MYISNAKEVAEFRARHPYCTMEKAKLTNDDKNTVVIRCAMHADLIVASIPYRQFCINPDKCAGYSSCPRNYACSE